MVLGIRELLGEEINEVAMSRTRSRRWMLVPKCAGWREKKKGREEEMRWGGAKILLAIKVDCAGSYEFKLEASRQNWKLRVKIGSFVSKLEASSQIGIL